MDTFNEFAEAALSNVHRAEGASGRDQTFYLLGRALVFAVLAAGQELKRLADYREDEDSRGALAESAAIFGGGHDND